MDTATIRQQLHEYIEQVSDKKAEGLYMFLADEIHEQHDTLSPEQIALLDAERRKHLAGESESCTWEEAKAMIRNRQSKTRPFGGNV